jgi:hypothetical protein
LNPYPTIKHGSAQTRVQRFTVACVGLLIVDFFVAVVSFTTCAEEGCSAWHELLDTVTIYAIPVLVLLAVIGCLGILRLRR